MPQFKNIPINRKNNVITKALFLFLFFLSFIFVLNFFHFAVKNSFYSFSAPFEKTLWSWGNNFSASVSPLINPRILLKENDDLKRKNAELLREIMAFQSSYKAGIAQNQVASNLENEHLDLMQVSIIGSDQEGMMVINQGSEAGLKVDMPVVDKQNILFGKVAKVYKDFAAVMMLSDKKSVINVKIKNDEVDPKDEVAGLLRGDESGVYLDLIPVEKQISADDIVVTSSLEKVFPKDLLIGKVTQVQKNSQNPFQQAKVTPFFDLADTDYLFVVKGYK